MNEWLSEKNQDVAPLPPPHPSKIEPLEVQVEEVMYVACKPSPRNALDHLRRNSTSSGSSPYSSLASLNKQCGENSIGSAKKVSMLDLLIRCSSVKLILALFFSYKTYSLLLQLLISSQCSPTELSVIKKVTLDIEHRL